MEMSINGLELVGAERAGGTGLESSEGSRRAEGRGPGKDPRSRQDGRI